MTNMQFPKVVAIFLATGWTCHAADTAVVRSVSSGDWSAASTWGSGHVPTNGDVVYIATGHQVRYDVDSSAVIRSIHLDGTLQFAFDKTTQLNVGLIRIGAGGSTAEEGFDCDAHAGGQNAAALLVGTPDQPVLAEHSVTIRLHHLHGLDPKSCPALVCCGGRLELHGAPLNRTWVKLGKGVQAGDREIELAEDVSGWRVGDRVILTATTRQNKVKKTFRVSTRDSTQTEERRIVSVSGRHLFLDQPVEFAHTVYGEYRGEVANLSRNVIVESAAPDGVRGHTMFHRNSSGSISYSEFRHLGKAGVLGRYSIHFHLVGDTMRGSSVIGASIWDSGNRWITIHGTNYLVVRDCVGYRSLGHGFFLEDGTETNNVLDRNLAVQAYSTKPLPDQVLPYDKNDGSGFWWANSLNTFTRNVAAECDEYGYFFQVAKTESFDPILAVRKSDGSRAAVDIRTLPFIRFEDNEAHCQRRHAINLGGGVPFGPPNVGDVGPDPQHPFVLRNLRLWNVHWAIHPVSPSVLLDNVAIHDAEYGVWRPEYRNHAYKGIRFDQVPDKQHFAFTSTNLPPNDEVDFPKPLAPVDDLPPVTVITRVASIDSSTVKVFGTTSDNGLVTKVLVNGREAQSIERDFSQWQITLPVANSDAIVAQAFDDSGNRELTPHRVK